MDGQSGKSFDIFDSREKKPSIVLKGENPGKLIFAANELQKYLGVVYREEFPIVDQSQHTGGKAVVLSEEKSEGKDSGSKDRFSICVKNSDLYIIGENYRSVLFGVYKFLEEYIGIKWVNPGYEHIPDAKKHVLDIRAKAYEPGFPKRGLVLENSESLEYITRIIDWMTKNYYNSIFFTFHLWEEYKNSLRDGIEKRGLLLTLGGHNIDLFLPSDKYFTANPEWYSLYDGKRVDTQPCFSNGKGTDTIIANIINYCRNEKIVDTICIWPNDNLYTCKCQQCTDKGFISTYIGFLDKLKERVEREKLDINIQHIAYNAQLEWDMLDAIPEESSLDTLLACWGRDYAYDIGNPANEYDIRFKRIIEMWADACNNRFKTKLSVFEYYGDYWMLTGLFPPLLKTIIKDVEFFKEIGVHEMTCLIVPYYLPMKIVYEELIKKEFPHDAREYELNSEDAVLWFNLYAFGRKIWDTGVTYETVMKDYSGALMGEGKEFACALLEKLEENLAGLSGFNTKLFGLNFKLLWLRDSWLKNRSISKKGSSEVIDWSPETDEVEIPESRIEACGKILDCVSIDKPEIEKLYTDGDDDGYKNLLNLMEYYNYVSRKIESIRFQSMAQVNIMKCEISAAVEYLTAALRIEKDINGWDRKSCEEWLGKLQPDKKEEVDFSRQ